MQKLTHMKKKFGMKNIFQLKIIGNIIYAVDEMELNEYFKKLNESQFENNKADLLAKLENARKYASIVEEMGHEVQVNVNVHNIEALGELINTVSNIYMTDLNTAYQNLESYNKQISNIKTELEKPVKKYNDIMSAKKFVDDSDNLIDAKLKKINQYVSNGFLEHEEKRQAEELIRDFNDKKGGTKGQDDWVEPGEEKAKMSNLLVISAALKALLIALDRFIQAGNNNEEDDKRKKREEEEEEERRSSYNSGSSYSSGSSFDFGGGMSGGGGAGGSW